MNMVVFSMRDPKDDLRRVNLFFEEPIEFSELLERSVGIPLESTTARIASISDLIQLKAALPGRSMPMTSAPYG